MYKTSNFICSCQYGMILLSADMIQSGKLSKYLLACLNWLLNVYGDCLAVGYDIGCDFCGTVNRSQLGERSQALHTRFYVGAFHSYAHNQKCQLGFHPHLLTTAGLEDFKTNEWIFSKQNLTAHLYRFGS
ncbi:hypothetical protein CALCODRAFT_427313 [Calocera cornea HHB12733]|uniref:Uncharacterized protein n=1 Tax=Calocera cornea HHB12733 TaxID=1353952 RepID=A0A165JDZ6_9BASI|nr:hypothetical protein CALCODRAFT_427313 [Calocera cornea HHB12733]